MEAGITPKSEKGHAENDAEIVMAPKRGSAAHFADFPSFLITAGVGGGGGGRLKPPPGAGLTLDWVI